MKHFFKCVFVFRMPSAAPPAAAGNGVPPSELEQLQIRAGEVTDEVRLIIFEVIELCNISIRFGTISLSIPGAIALVFSLSSLSLLLDYKLST